MPPYYVDLEPHPQIARNYIELLALIKTFARAGDARRAAIADRIYNEMLVKYELLGRDGAREADRLIRAHIEGTRKRPRRSGDLAKAIQSHPIPTVLPTGGVHIADIGELDRGTAVRGGKSYWRSQEYGLPVIPGQRPAPGYFQPGNSRPDPGQFRVHPYFQRQGYNRGSGTPALVRKKPLEARKFLDRGSEDLAAWHKAEMKKIDAWSGRELRKLIV